MTGRDAENTALKTYCVPGTFFSSVFFYKCYFILTTTVLVRCSTDPILQMRKARHRKHIRMSVKESAIKLLGYGAKHMKL